MNASQKIALLDLSAVRADLVRFDGLTPAQADDSVSLYRQFLTLCAQRSDTPICPPSLADKAWHRHLARTVTYRKDCLSIFGAPLDHDPDAFGTPSFEAAWAETRKLYRDQFGVELEADATALEASALAPAVCYRPPLPLAA